MSGVRWNCCECCAGIASDDHVEFGGSVRPNDHDGPCTLCDQRASESHRSEADRG